MSRFDSQSYPLQPQQPYVGNPAHKYARPASIAQSDQHQVVLIRAPAHPGSYPDVMYGTFPQQHNATSIRRSDGEGRSLRRSCATFCSFLAGHLVASLALIGLFTLIMLAWPRSPRVTAESTQFRAFRIHWNNTTAVAEGGSPVSLDVELLLNLNVLNPNLAGLRYTSIVADLIYREEHLGSISTAAAGRIAPWSSQIVPVDLEMVGFQVLGKTVDLVADLARRRMDLIVVTTIQGCVELLALAVPIKASFKHFTKTMYSYHTMSSF